MYSKNFKVRMHGSLACFTRPEFSTERVSYDLITPSAARGVLEALLWKPAIQWEIVRISLLARIRYVRFKRNEVNSKLSTQNAFAASRGARPMPDFFADEDRAQRNTMALRDVDYGVDAHFRLTERAGPTDNMRKFEDIFERRLTDGKQHYQPYLGCREFPASVDPWDGSGVLTTESRMLGWMLLDIAFGTAQGDDVVNQPRFFAAELRQGVVGVPAWKDALPSHQEAVRP